MMMKIIFHIGTVLCFYIFSRITIRSRVYEHERTEKWNEKVQKSEHDVEDFLSNISHEFRTPVNAINGMVAILKKDVDREELDSISEACARLGYQIEDIQDYTEISRGDIILEEENYMCTSLINDVVAYYNSIDTFLRQLTEMVFMIRLTVILPINRRIYPQVINGKKWTLRNVLLTKEK